MEKRMDVPQYVLFNYILNSFQKNAYVAAEQTNKKHRCPNASPDETNPNIRGWGFMPQNCLKLLRSRAIGMGESTLGLGSGNSGSESWPSTHQL